MMTSAGSKRQDAAADGRTAYLVLGMHRSGTSATTQLLSLAGARLPKNVMPADEHNTQGYFEPWRIATFNDERLRAAGSAWDDVFVFPCPTAPAEAHAAWRDRAIALFAEEFGTARHPLIKDPRVTVLITNAVQVAVLVFGGLVVIWSNGQDLSAGGLTAFYVLLLRLYGPAGLFAGAFQTLTLSAEGNTFSGPTDCTSSTKAIARQSSCTGGADVGVVAASGTTVVIDLSSCQ